MNELLTQIKEKFDLHLATYFTGGLHHSLSPADAGRPRLVFKVSEGMHARNTNRMSDVPVQVTYFVVTESDTSCIDLMERVLAVMPDLACARDVEFRGRTIDEMEEQDQDGTSVWEGTCLLEYSINYRR